MCRADHVGSLLRPADLTPFHSDTSPGAKDQRRQLEDAAITRAVTLQRELGLSVVSDGEFRRDSATAMLAATLADVGAGAGGSRVLDEARFLQNLLAQSGGSGAPFKITLPAASTLPSPLAARLRREVRALIAAGVPYIQIQATAYASCLAQSRAADLDALLAADFAALEGLARPEEVRLALYVGRGAADRAGLFDEAHVAFAEKLLSSAPVDRFVLEVDEDTTDFSALRHVPKHKSVALGLLGTRTAQLEERDAVLDRLDQATAHIEGDFLAVCPQTGFADSGLSEDDQRRKLELIVSISTRYWGFEA
jgi:5-methyltetrahydropteroyltriglutamate--homocysteine methyltransferase